MPSRAMSWTAASRILARALARAAARLASTARKLQDASSPLRVDGCLRHLDALVRHAVRHLDVGHVTRAVVPEVREALALLVVERLGGERLQVPDLVEPDADALADAGTELVVDHVQVPQHPLLDRAVALGEAVAEVRDQVVLLPLLGEVVALAGLLVVIGAREPGPGQAALDVRPLLDMPRLGRLLESAGDRRLVVDGRVVAVFVLV